MPLFQNESPCKSFLLKISFVCMKINLQVKLIVVRMVSHENLFLHRGREYSEIVYFVNDCEKMSNRPYAC